MLTRCRAIQAGSPLVRAQVVKLSLTDSAIAPRRLALCQRNPLSTVHLAFRHGNVSQASQRHGHAVVRLVGRPSRIAERRCCREHCFDVVTSLCEIPVGNSA